MPEKRIMIKGIAPVALLLIAFTPALSQALDTQPVEEKASAVKKRSAITDEETKPKPPDPTSSPTPSQTKKEKRGRFVIAPIPILSPAVDSGLVLVAAYVFQMNKEDKKSPPSTVGLAAAFTTNGSRGGGIGGRLYFDENKYQTTFVLGRGRVNYDFFGIGRRPGHSAISVPMEQGGTIVYGEFMRNVWKDIFIGGGFLFKKLYARIDVRPPGGFEVPAIDAKANSAAIHFHVQRDRRDSTFYPTKGTLVDVIGNFFDQSWGSKRQYQTYKLAYNGFRTVKEKQVLAYRAMICSANQNVPFYDLCFYGFDNDIRGYTAGEFQNRRMFATQAEYRVELRKRLGVVAFGGLGSVAHRWNEFRVDQFLPAAGAGLRFTLDKKDHINYRIDWAIGRAGHTLSIGIGEAF
jgi:hypothetical protein